MNRPPKDILAFALSAILRGYAARNGLQIVAIVAFFAALCVVYKSAARTGAELVLDLLGRARRAKYGDFELNIEDGTFGSLIPLTDAPSWIRGMLSKMVASHVGIVVAIDRSQNFKVTGGLQKRLRELRDLGLIEHDGRGLSESSHV